jgi:hypothetical protein
MKCDKCFEDSDLWREWGNGVVCFYCLRPPVILPADGWYALCVWPTGHDIEKVVAFVDGEPILREGGSVHEAWGDDVAFVFHESQRPSAADIETAVVEHRAEVAKRMAYRRARAAEAEAKSSAK